MNKVQAIKRKIEKLQQDITTIQNQCPHDNVEKKYGGDVGNYDPCADSYWVTLHCNDCDKLMATVQKKKQRMLNGLND